MIDIHSEELVDLSRTAAAIADECEGKTVRQVLQSFAEAGLLGAGASECVGGLGLPISFDAAIINAASPKPIRDAVLDALLAARHCPDDRVVQSIIGGKAMVAIAPASDLTVTGVGSALSGSANCVPFAAEADYLLTAVSRDGRQALALLDLRVPGLVRLPVEGFDATFSCAHVVINGSGPIEALLSDDAAYGKFRDDYMLFMAWWLLKQAETCLAATTEFVSNRRQFGRALASFQSVRFTLAQIVKELHGLALLASPDAAPADRMLAYTYAAEIVPAAIEKCMHLHGGMGYTEEVALHLYLRRARGRLFAGEGLEMRRTIVESVQ